MIEQLHEFILLALHWLKDPQALVAVVGYSGMAAIIFAETGLLLGFFLPGDSLLVAAGLLASRGMSASGALNILWLGALLNFAAVLGDGVGYAIGKAAGPLLYERKQTLFFRRSHLLRAQEFYNQHGGKTIILARFIPIVRTFAPTVAGAAQMPYLRFFLYNFLGGTLWIWSLLLGGFFLGRSIPNIDKYIHLLILAILILSVAPLCIKFLKDRKKSSTADKLPSVRL